jgi:hypothetical protein
LWNFIDTDAAEIISQQNPRGCFLGLEKLPLQQFCIAELQSAETTLSVRLADYIKTTRSLERGTIITRQGEPSPFAVPQQNFLVIDRRVARPLRLNGTFPEGFGVSHES